MTPVNPCIASLLTFLAACAVSLTAFSAPPAFERAAANAGVPVDVLYSIAKTESGVHIEGYGLHPWPWTLNVQGTPERFASRDKALRRLKLLIRDGITDVDIGLMQIHWRYHRQRFANPAEALSVDRNLEVGAQILRELWNAGRDLWRAIGEYHAGTANGDEAKRRADAYRQRVARSLVSELGNELAN